jgi:hypothetical protein
MAIVKYSSLVDGVRNKIGNQVFSQNRYGPFVRDWVIPANPSTASQVHVRSNEAAISAAWRNLDNETRAIWNEATLSYPRTNSLGETYYLSGFNFFMSCNLYLLPYTTIIQADWQASEMPSAISISQLDCNGAANSFELCFDYMPNSSSLVGAVYASRALSAGVNYCKSEFRFIGFIECTGQTRSNMWTQYTNVFTYLGVDYKYFAQLKIFNSESGLCSPPTQISGIGHE